MFIIWGFFVDNQLVVCLFDMPVSGQFCCKKLTKMKGTSIPGQNESALNHLKTVNCRIILVIWLLFITGFPAIAQQYGAVALFCASFYNFEQEAYAADFLTVRKDCNPVPETGCQVTFAEGCCINQSVTDTENLLDFSALSAETAAFHVDRFLLEDTVTVNALSCELVIPNGFSPNSDGIQDTWRIKCIENYPNARVEVFNRWGNLVYEKENYGNIDFHGPADAWWDGRSTHKWTLGKDFLPAGTYFYILDLKDGSKPRNGFLYLNK